MVDTAVVDSIKKKIEEKRSRMEELEEQKRAIDSELPTVKGDLEALTKTLEIFQGKKAESSLDVESLPPSNIDQQSPFKAGSMPDIAYTILKKFGAPLYMPNLVEEAKKVKPDIKRDSFEAGIYGILKDGKGFIRVDGKIGLLEWK